MRGGLQELRVVQLGELAPLVRGGEPLELAEGLPPQVGAVDEEEDAPGTGVLDQPVHLVAGHEGLAASGGHLHQGPRPVLRQGLFQVRDGALLRGPEVGGVQGRHGPEPLAQVSRYQIGGRRVGCLREAGAPRFRDAKPLGQCHGRMKGKDRAASRLRVQPVGELRFRAGALVQEGEGTLVGGKVVGQAGAVLLRLHFDATQGEALRLGFDDAHGLPVDVEEVVGGAVAWLEAELAYGDAAGGVQVDGAGVLHRSNRPAPTFRLS